MSMMSIICILSENIQDSAPPRREAF